LAQQLGVEMKLPSVSPQPHTRLAHEATEFAKAHGKGGEFAHAVFAAFFQRGEDIGQIDVLARLGGEVGLNADELRRALETSEYRQQTFDLLRQAHMQMITAVPTFQIGRQRVTGLYPVEALREIIEAQTTSDTA
jgi:predicted DsbA family dithiol-disulfide isomerase